MVSAAIAVQIAEFEIDQAHPPPATWAKNRSLLESWPCREGATEGVGCGIVKDHRTGGVQSGKSAEGAWRLTLSVRSLKSHGWTGFLGKSQMLVSCKALSMLPVMRDAITGLIGV